jgi:glucokinase
MRIIGIDSGASFTRLWDGEHEVQRLRTPFTYTQYLQLLCNLLKEHKPIQSLVVALPALVEGQYIIKGANLGDDWRGKNIVSDIRNLTQITGQIAIRQDVDVAGYGVQNQELDNLEPTLLITISTGVGGALVTRNNVLPLEVGHMPLNLSGKNMKCGCGQYGCVEADLSGTGIYNRMGVHAENLENPDFWPDYGTQLGQFLLVLTSLFKLRQVILTGGVSKRYQQFIEQTNLYLSTNLKHVAIPTTRLSRLGDNLGIYGALWLAKLGI